MRDQIRILGILNVVLGSLGALVGILIFLVFGGLAAGVGLSGAGQDAAAAVPILGAIGFFIAAFIILLSLPTIIGGWGLLKFKPWSRVVMIIVSVLNLIHVPFGTALGIFGLIVLLNDESRRLLESGGQIYAQAGVPVTNYPPPGV